MAYVRLEITKIRSATNAMQMQEFEFYDVNNVKIQPTGVTSSLTPYPGEGIENLIDGDSNTKFCTTDWGGSATGLCIITFTFDSFSDIERIHHYKYMTGDTSTERDPISWTLSKSEDGITYEEVVSVKDASISTNRKQYTGIFYFFQFYWYIKDGKLNNVFFQHIQSNTIEEPKPISIWGIKNNTPTNGFFPSLSQPITQPIPPSIWYKDPVYGAINDLLPRDFLTIKLAWYIKDGKPTNDLFPEISEVPIKPIYPDSIWRLGDDNTVTNLLLLSARYEPEPDIPVEETDSDINNPFNYDNIINYPTLNGAEINGDISFDELGIKEMTSSMVSKLLLETFDVII